MSEPAPKNLENSGPSGSSMVRARKNPLGNLFPTPRSGMGTALILLAFIVFPSALLGFLSWRAVENERSFSMERLHDSYRHFGRLAAAQIDVQLGMLEGRWTSEIDSLMGTAATAPTREQLVERTGKEPLISGFFLIRAPHDAIYPPMPMADETARAGAFELEAHAREHAVFAGLVARGEEQEYDAGNLEAALVAYQEILGRVTSPQLHAMAQSYIGRVQLKQDNAAGALATFRRLLERHPEARDLNRMYLRFLAQYQLAVALEALGRKNDALETLLELNQDLLKRSDAINTTQYSYYSDLIQTLALRLLGSPGLRDVERHERAFKMMSEQNKKRISDRYFIQLLDAELNEAVVRRRHFTAQTHYLSASAEGEPFLLAYRTLPDSKRIYAVGILAAQISLHQLQTELLPTIRNLQTGSETAVAIIGAEGGAVIDPEATQGTPIAVQGLSTPFDFWQAAIYLRDVPGAIKSLDLRATLGLWLISLLLLSILIAAYAFILRARREAMISRAQTTFVSKVTHELRTPLSSIKMFAELLEMRMADTSRGSDAEFRKNAEQHLGLIQQECDRLSRLIDRVIDFSQVERRVRHYQFEYHDIEEIVSRVLDLFRPYAEAHGIDIQLTAEASLPELALDTDGISQVLLNLLSNAVQFSGDAKEIQVHVSQRDSSVAISITDHGIGIAPREMPRVFDMFYTSRRRMDSNVPGGLGLGLSLSREIVRAHGGEILVRSEVGHGSTFTIVIPVTTRSPLMAAPPSEEFGGDLERRVGQRG